MENLRKLGGFTGWGRAAPCVRPGAGRRSLCIIRPKSEERQEKNCGGRCTSVRRIRGRAAGAMGVGKVDETEAVHIYGKRALVWRCLRLELSTNWRSIRSSAKILGGSDFVGKNWCQQGQSPCGETTANTPTPEFVKALSRAQGFHKVH